jgi:hypothetical protein
MQHVLRLSFMVNLSCGSAWFESPKGGSVLEMKPSEDPSWGAMLGRVPQPPIVSAQMDILGEINILGPLQRAVLSGLHRMTSASKPQNFITASLNDGPSFNAC